MTSTTPGTAATDDAESLARRIALAEALVAAKLRSAYARLGTTPDHAVLLGATEWLRRAHALVRCARSVLSITSVAVDPCTTGVAMMLAGMSAEVSLKGALIARHPWPVDDATLAGITGKSHNLGALAQDAGLDLRDGDHARLAQLAEFVTWAGRYPTARTLERHQAAQANLTPLDDNRALELVALSVRSLDHGMARVEEWIANPHFSLLQLDD